MSFLAPLFLLGALAVIGPIIFHLIRRTTREKTPFSTLMFLQPTPPRITRRSRIENLWLLLLRCAILALLAIAFARPFFRQERADASAPSGKQRTVVLIDTSASLRREGLWAQEMKAANERIRQLVKSDEVAILAFDRAVRPLMTFEDWNGLQPDERSEIAAQRLDQLSPSWSGTQLDAAIIRAAELLDAKRESEPTDRKIVIVSDLQEGAALDQLQGYEWPNNTSVDVVAIGPALVNNVSVQWIPDSDESQSATEEAQLRLRVANSAGNSREQFSIRWVNANSSSDSPPPIPAYAPAGQSRIVRLSRSPSKDANAIAIDGDEVSFDNTVHLVPPQPLRIPILFLGQESAADAQSLLYYLHRAFPKTGSQSVEIIAHGSEQPVPAFQVQDAELVLLGETPGASAISAARTIAKSGRFVVMALTSVQSGAVLANLLELPPIEVTEASVRDYALLGEINFQHPLFAPFADSRFSDFTKIHYWKHRQLDAAAIPGAQVIAKFDRGAPAVVQVPLGRGSVVVFTSSWRPIDGQLALSSKFVPLLHALLEQSSDIPVTKAQYVVGDSIPLHSTNANTTVRKPDGAAITIAAGTTAFEADQPGIYQVSPGNRRFVVNLSPEESQLAPLPLDRFRALGVPLQAPVVDPTTLARRAAAAQAIDLENRQKAWRWLIAAALAVLLIEVLIAGKLSGANRSSTVSTS